MKSDKMKSSVLRVVLVNFLSVLLLFSLPFLDFSTSVSASKKSEIKTEKEEVLKPTENPKEKEETKSTTETVKGTSAKAIKGNIISQYSSPYVASNNYDNVYLKNNTNLNISIKLMQSSFSFL